MDIFTKKLIKESGKNVLFLDPYLVELIYNRNKKADKYKLKSMKTDNYDG